MQRRRCLVAGAGGFIGGHLARELVARGYEVRAVDIKPVDAWYQTDPLADNRSLDLADPLSCEVASDGIDYVYDLAADMGGMGFIERHRVECMRSVLVSVNLLDAAARMGVKRFFFSSSACVYNIGMQTNSDVTALKESDAYPAMPEDGYGWEKLYTERLALHYRLEKGLETRIARYHNVYGPEGTWDGGREKAPAAVCRKVAMAALNGTDGIEIWGDGNQTRSFMYIDDCVEGTIRIMESDYAEPLNLGSAELVSINGLVDMVEGIAGIKLKRTYDLTAPRGVQGRNSDNTLISQVLGWAPATPLEAGLRETYRWIDEQVRSGQLDPDVEGRLTASVSR